MEYPKAVAQVLLVNANWGSLFSGRVRRYNRRFPPLDLLNCASLLREAGHTVELMDCRAEPTLRDTVLKTKADLLILSLSPLDRWQCPNTDLEQLDRFIDGMPMNRTIVYGAQVTLKPLTLLRRTGAAGAILGEPESSVVSLAAGACPGDIPGTARISSDGCLIGGERGPDIALTALPIPAFDLLKFEVYSYEVLGEQFGLLELTRGCPWRCKFCLLDMYGKKYRRKSVEQMLVEIEFAMRHGMRCAYFQDLEFTLDHDLVSEFCEAMITAEIALPWSCQTRPDTTTPELLALMRRAGCELIHFGVESGVPSVVAATGKKQSLDSVQKAIQAAHNVGMRTLCYFLIGMPGESALQMQQTLDFAVDLGPTYASFQVATPYPKTPWHGEYFEESTDAFPSVFDSELNEVELRQYSRRLTARYHLRPGYVFSRLRTPGRRAALRETKLLAKYLFTR